MTRYNHSTLVETPLAQDTLPAACSGFADILTQRSSRPTGSTIASYAYHLTQAVQRYFRQLLVQPYRHGSGSQHRRATSLHHVLYRLDPIAVIHTEG